MKEIMTSKGWMIIKECHCGGTYRVEYAKLEIPGVTVKTFPNKGTWRASRKGRKIKEGSSEQLEQFINELA